MKKEVLQYFGFQEITIPFERTTFSCEQDLLKDENGRVEAFFCPRALTDEELEELTK
jgi:hypothetical protein